MKQNWKNNRQGPHAPRIPYPLSKPECKKYEARRGIGGWIEEEEEEPEETHWDIGTQTEEEEPEETHWDKGTQTEDDMMDQYLPLKKRPLRTEEETP